MADFTRDGVTIHCGDCVDVMRGMEDASIHCCVTSPPYWGLRDYGVDGQLGLESTLDEYVAKMVEVFAEVRRVLRHDGTLWLNMGDSYATRHFSDARGASYPRNLTQGNNCWKGTKLESRKTYIGNTVVQQTLGGWGLKSKDICGIPWRVAFALQSYGWYLRQDIIWHKPNPMPESATDRCTKSHEYIFLLAKSQRYYFDQEAIKELAKYAGKTVTLGEKSLSKGQAKGANVSPSGNAKANSVMVADNRNKRSVWTVQSNSYPKAHFATFPPDLIQPCILAGSPEGGTVLDPFLGSGTTAAVAQQYGRKCIGIELNAEYVELCIDRFEQRKLFV